MTEVDYLKTLGRCKWMTDCHIHYEDSDRVSVAVNCFDNDGIDYPYGPYFYNYVTEKYYNNNKEDYEDLYKHHLIHHSHFIKYQIHDISYYLKNMFMFQN